MADELEMSRRPRIVALDTLRGATILSMVAFHTCYDAAYLYGFSLPWFTGTLFQDIWRATISWTFLVLAGWMTQFSRSNLRRGALYAVAALSVWAATALTGVDTPISFGIIFCMAASTLLYSLFEHRFKRLRHPLALAGACIILFVATYHLPQARYDIEGLAWLGLPSPAFSSGDYYPLLPYALLYACGALLAKAYHDRHGMAYPAFMMRDWAPPLTALGKASLPVYLVHQPLLIALFEIVTHFIR